MPLICFYHFCTPTPVLFLPPPPPPFLFSLSPPPPHPASCPPTPPLPAVVSVAIFPSPDYALSDWPQDISQRRSLATLHPLLIIRQHVAPSSPDWFLFAGLLLFICIYLVLFLCLLALLLFICIYLVLFLCLLAFCCSSVSTWFCFSVCWPFSVDLYLPGFVFLFAGLLLFICIYLVLFLSLLAFCCSSVSTWFCFSVCWPFSVDLYLAGFVFLFAGLFLLICILPGFCFSVCWPFSVGLYQSGFASSSFSLVFRFSLRWMWWGGGCLH